MQEYSRQLSTELVRFMPGNHFFFLGAAGARRAAGHIEELWRAAEDLHLMLAGTLTMPAL